MTATILTPLLIQRFADNNGNPLARGQLFSYQAGTTTPLATFTDSTGNTPNANPVILNARGEAPVWIPPNVAYKFVLEDANGTTIYTVDQVTNAQLISLYGGVDTGIANQYIINFASPLPANTNGQVIYWLPSNSNNGPSTINVNAAGPQPILNPNGSVLGANQILAGQFVSIISINGVWQLYGGSGVGVNVGTFGAETPIAAAATTDLGSATGHNVQITGMGVSITSFGTSAQAIAPIYVVRFGSSNTLVNSTSLVLPQGVNITTNAGDALLAEFMGSGTWRVLIYQSAAAYAPQVQIKTGDTAVTSNATLTADPVLQSGTLSKGAYEFEILLIFDSVAAGAGFQWEFTGTAADTRGSITALISGLVNAASAVSISTISAAVTYATVSTATDSNQILIKGSLLISTPGTLGIKWAQNTSTASATTLRAGSYLNITLVSNSITVTTLQHVYTSGSGTETIPAGYTSCLAEVWGAGGGGGAKFQSGNNGAGGGGGASGGYCAKTISVVGQGGKTLNYQVGAAGALFNPGALSSVASGTLSITTLQANGGAQGGNASSLTTPGLGGAGGTASGGDTNTTGNPGNAGQSSAAGAHGGGGGNGVSGVNGGGNPGGAGQGVFQDTGATIPGTAGGAGYIVFTYTP